MVKLLKKTWRIGFLGTAFVLAACSGKFWGEAPPPPQVASAPKKESACPSANKILSGSEEESALAMDCLESDMEELWGKIQGGEKHALSTKEIDVLIEKGVLDLADGDKNLSHKKAKALLALLALDQKLTRTDTKEILSWLRSNRQELRETFQKVEKGDIEYKELQSILGLSASYLRLRNWNMSRQEMGEHLLHLIEEGKADSATPEAILVVHDVLGLLCPNHAASSSWKGTILANCLDSLREDFTIGADWVQFVLNQTGEEYDFAKIHKSLELFSQRIEAKMKDPSLLGLHPILWVNLAKKMKAAPPESFLDSLDLIRNLHPQSSGRYIHPGAASLALQIVKKYHEYLFQGMPAFLEAKRNGQCLSESEGKDWRACVLPFDKKKKDKRLELAYKLRNSAYGTDAAPLSGKEFKRLALFHAFASEIIRGFDENKDGVISSRFGGDKDEVMDLLGVALNSIDILGRFIENMQLRFDGVALKEQEPFSSFSHLDLKGMARLVTMAGSDILVQRDAEDRFILKKILSNITNSFPTNSLQLDQSAVSAILVFVDSFGSFRDAYLQMPETQQGIARKEHDRFDKILVHRNSVIQKLPAITEKHFPRTFESCQKFGWDISCEIALDEIFPSPDQGSEYTSASDLDLLTLVMGSMESLLDSCDYDSNGALGWSLWDGEDELDCTFNKFSNITKRMMESKLVHVDEKGKVNAALNTLNSFFLTRAFAKVALIKGSTSGIVAAPLSIWFHGDATIGSIYALLAEILAKDKVEARKQVREKP